MKKKSVGTLNIEVEVYRCGSRKRMLFREYGHSPAWAVHGNMHFVCTAQVAGPKLRKYWELFFQKNNFP